MQKGAFELNKQTKLRHTNKYSSHSHSCRTTMRLSNDTQINENTKEHRFTFFTVVNSKGNFSRDATANGMLSANLNNSLYFKQNKAIESVHFAKRCTLKRLTFAIGIAGRNLHPKSSTNECSNDRNCWKTATKKSTTNLLKFCQKWPKMW